MYEDIMDKETDDHQNVSCIGVQFLNQNYLHTSDEYHQIESDLRR